MDFTGRGSQPAQPASTGPQYSGGTPAAGTKKTSKTSKKSMLARWGAGVLGLLVVALFVAVIFVIAFGNKEGEAAYVDEDKLQAVFLQTGQVYFGKISKDSVTDKSFVLSNIYYLQTSNGANASEQTAASTNVSLVKLGCELHAPFDRMVINRDQITFWENLQDDGQVAKAVTTFEKENPDGQKCAEQNSSTQTQTQSQSQSTTNSSSSTQSNSSDN